MSSAITLGKIRKNDNEFTSLTPDSIVKYSNLFSDWPPGSWQKPNTPPFNFGDSVGILSYKSNGIQLYDINTENFRLLTTDKDIQNSYTHVLNAEDIMQFIEPADPNVKYDNMIVKFKSNDKESRGVIVRKEYILNNSQGGQKPKHKYKGRTYVLRTGIRGGKYIIVQGNKIYI
jgi:hypothetical protein